MRVQFYINFGTRILLHAGARFLLTDSMEENSFLTKFLDGIPVLREYSCHQHNYLQAHNYCAVHISFQLGKAITKTQGSFQLGKAYHLRHKEEYVPDFLHFPFMVA